MKHIRWSLLVTVAIMAALMIGSGLASAGVDYPPSTTTTTDDPDRSTTTAATLVPAEQAGQGQAGALAFTGSDRTLLWVGLGLLTAGTVAFVSTRRRAELRRQATVRSLG